MKLDALRKIAAIFPAVVCLLTMPLLTSCATDALWAKQHGDERFSSVLVSEDNKKLIVVGEQDDYIFDAPDIVGKSLSASFGEVIFLRLNDFFVSGDKVSGTIELSLNHKWLENEATDKEKSMAMAMGYEVEKYHGVLEQKEEWMLSLSTPISGIRYAAGSVKHPKSRKLKDGVTVTVTCDHSVPGIVLRILATPVALVFDAVTFPFIVIALKDGIL